MSSPSDFFVFYILQCRLFYHKRVAPDLILLTPGDALVFDHCSSSAVRRALTESHTIGRQDEFSVPRVRAHSTPYALARFLFTEQGGLHGEEIEPR